MLPKNPAWHCSLQTPTSPGSILKCESATRWPCWIEARHQLHLWPSRSYKIERARPSCAPSSIYYAAPIWFIQVSSTHLDKLEVIQNKALRIATSCYQTAATSHLRAETGVLPLSVHLELCSQQFYASTLHSMHPSHLIVTFPSDLRPPGLLPPYLDWPANKRWQPQCPSLIFGGVLEEGTYPLARW